MTKRTVIEYYAGGTRSDAGTLSLHGRLLSFPPYRAMIRAGVALGVKPRSFVSAIPYVWLLVFFLAPFFIVFKLSFADVRIGIPPYTPLFELSEEGHWQLAAHVKNYLMLVTKDLYWVSYVTSVKIAFVSTLFSLAVGFPIAYGMSRAPLRWQPVLVMMVILPFWTSFLIRVYAWIGILKNEGLLKVLLVNLGVIDAGYQLNILNTNTAVYIGIVYSYLPFMVLPLYANLVKLDPTLLEAAADLGCRPIKAFWRITVPIAVPGILAGCFLVFIPAVGEFVIPDLLGGSETKMIGKTLWQEFFNNRDWPLSSAVAVILVSILVIPIVLFQHISERSQREGQRA